MTTYKLMKRLFFLLALQLPFLGFAQSVFDRTYAATSPVILDSLIYAVRNPPENYLPDGQPDLPDPHDTASMNKRFVDVTLIFRISDTALVDKIDLQLIDRKKPGEKFDFTFKLIHQGDKTLLYASNRFTYEIKNSRAYFEFPLQEKLHGRPWELRIRAKDKNGDYSNILKKSLN